MHTNPKQYANRLVARGRKTVTEQTSRTQRQRVAKEMPHVSKQTRVQYRFPCYTAFCRWQIIAHIKYIHSIDANN